MKKTKSKTKSALTGLHIAFFVLCFGALLALTLQMRSFGLYQRSQEQIKHANRVLKEVLPDFENQPLEEVFELAGKEIYPARIETQSTGFAFLVWTRVRGEAIQWMLGFSAQGELTGLEILNDERLFIFGENLKDQKNLKDRAFPEAPLFSKTLAESKALGFEFIKTHREELKEAGVLSL